MGETMIAAVVAAAVAFATGIIKVLRDFAQVYKQIDSLQIEIKELHKQHEQYMQDRQTTALERQKLTLIVETMREELSSLSTVLSNHTSNEEGLMKQVLQKLDNLS